MRALGARNIASDSRKVRGSRAVCYRATGNFLNGSKPEIQMDPPPKASLDSLSSANLLAVGRGATLARP